MKENIVQFRVKRFDPEKNESKHQFYEIPFREGMTVLEALWHIVDNVDGTLSFRYSCRGAVCGSCTMNINGINDLACHVQISDILPGVINIEPMPRFPLIKDLVVDMTDFFNKYRSVKPYFTEGEGDDKENIQSPKDRMKIAKSSTCILCAACHADCPLTGMDDDYLGPAVLTTVHRFAMDSRDSNCKERIMELSDLEDFGGCMKISRCTKVCPREIEPSERIEEIKQCVSKFRKPKPEKIKTVCGYCSVGCGLEVEKLEDGELKLTTDSDYVSSLGMACPKGWDALLPLKAKDRALEPKLRNEKGELEKVSWDKALKTFTEKFKAIQDKHGPDSIAFLSTGQIPFEEMAFLGTLAKFGLGIKHGDGNTRQCMATAAVAYKQSFGFDAPPYTYKDLEESDVLIFVGANPFISHPIMWERTTLNKNKYTTIVIDPRNTETAHQANIHYAIKPKADAALFYCITNILIERGIVDKDFVEKNTEGFHEYKEFVKDFSIKDVSKTSGLSEAEINDLAGIIEKGEKVSFWWTMGVNQSFMGVRTAQSIINLCLITGNIGRPGTGPNSITGQCNAMGSRLFSNTTCLPAGYDFAKAEDRQHIADCLGIDVEKIPHDKGWSYDKILEGVANGTVKGLWIIATNPAHSWIDHNDLMKNLKNLEFCVVQDMYDSTETVECADLMLPAAGWGEKTGTFINSERRIAVVNKVADPPGEALPDIEIFKKIAKYWGCDQMFKNWNSAEDVFQTLKKISKGTPCDITGIKDYKMIEDQGGIQWPLPEGTKLEENERRLFEDGKFFTDNGKAKLLFEDIPPAPEEVNKEFPFLLLTGRGTVAQFHTQTRTGKSERLRKIYPAENYLEINPIDAENLNIEENDKVAVASRRGEIKINACLTYDVPQGEVFVPMHYKNTNELTFPAFDPYSRQPSYKYCAVKIAKCVS